MSYAAFHWRLYNLLKRAFGVMACFAGILFIVQAPFHRVGWADGPPLTISQILSGMVVGFLSLALGIFVCRRPTYRPDLGDIGYFSHTTGEPMPIQPPRGRRSWWTGEPKSAKPERDHAA